MCLTEQMYTTDYVIPDQEHVWFVASGICQLHAFQGDGSNSQGRIFGHIGFEAIKENLEVMKTKAPCLLRFLQIVDEHRLKYQPVCYTILWLLMFHADKRVYPTIPEHAGTSWPTPEQLRVRVDQDARDENVVTFTVTGEATLTFSNVSLADPIRAMQEKVSVPEGALSKTYHKKAGSVCLDGEPNADPVRLMPHSPTLLGPLTCPCLVLWSPNLNRSRIRVLPPVSRALRRTTV